MNELKEYIVTLHRYEDLDAFYQDMETDGGDLYIPNRIVDCHLRRPVSRNTHYMLSDQEASQLQNDPRILAVELTPEQLGIDIAPDWTQTSSLWSKSDILSQGQLNWGLLRVTEGQPRANWYNNGTTPNVSGTVTVPFSGKNVDVVIMDGRMEVSHPEFAVNVDGTGGSRVVQFNWYSLDPTVTGGSAATYSYTPQDTSDDWHGTFVGGIVAGNTHGWAKDANIYNISPSYVIGGVDSTYLFDYVKVWHQNKTTNPSTGRKNPTIINGSFGYSRTVAISDVTSIVYRGTTYTGPFTDAQLTSYGLLVSGTNVIIPTRVTSLEADIADCIAAGVIFVASAGNSYTKMDIAGGTDYDNTLTYNFLYLGTNYPQTVNPHRGASPGSAPNVICVGAINARYNAAGEEKASYSNCGPRVDVFAPGSNIRSSSNVYQGNSEVADTRSPSFYVGRSNGTSFSGPQVAGLLATMLEVTEYGPTGALGYVTGNAKTGQLYNSNNLDYYDLQGAPNRYLFAKYPTTKSIVPDVVSVTPSQIVVYTITVSDLSTNYDSFVYLTESGTSTGTDFIDGVTQTRLLINSGTVTWSRTVRSGITGTRTSTIQLRTGGYDGNIQATSSSVTVTDGVVLPITYVSFVGVTNNPTSNTVLIEGQYTATFTLTTTNAPNGTVVYWTTLVNPNYSINLTIDDFTDNLLQGTATIQNNIATITRSARADVSTDGVELFLLEIHEDDYSSPVKIQSNYIGIADTSTTPAPPPPPGATYSVALSANAINEGSVLTVTVTTTSVPDSTQLFWTATNSGDLDAGSGSFTISNNSGTFSIVPVTDLTTEGSETFIVSVKTISTSNVDSVFTSNPITINDTSTTPISQSQIFGTNITPTEYNGARASVIGKLGTSVTGTPLAVYGYGQAVVSSPVSQYEKVTEAQLDLLRQDITKAYTHQNGAAPTITDVTASNKALASLFTQYNNFAIGIFQNESSSGASPYTYTTTVAANQTASVNYTQTETYAAYTGTAGTGAGWKNYAFYELEVTFSNANDARYFFNTGSVFNFTASRTGGTISPTIGLDQNTSWTTLLQTVTSENPAFDKSKFYALTSSYAVFYNKNSTGTYAANRYTLSAKCDVANNSLGGATVVTIKIEFVDAFNDGNTTNYDGVDGTFTSTVTRKMPKGAGAGGAVTVNAPTSIVPTPTNGLTENGTPIYITAAYQITCSPTTVTEASSVVALSFTATNYNVPNTVTWTITATTTTGLSDFVQTGWTPGTNLQGFKTLTRTTTTSGTYANSTSSTSITTNPDTTTEGTETFVVSAVGSTDGSGGGFTVTTPDPITVTDSSKTATPGITITGSTALTTTPTGSGTSGQWTITSQALTGTASLIIYGFYLDISLSTGIDSYVILPPSNSNFPNPIITQANGQYTLPTPYTLASGSSFILGVGVTSNTGPFPSTTTVKLKIVSNAGTIDGSGASTGPSYTTTSKDISVSILTPTLNLSWTANPSSVSYKFISPNSGSGSTTLTLTNNGTGRAEIVAGSYLVSSPGGTVTPGVFPVTFLLPNGDAFSVSGGVTYSSNSAYNSTSTVSIIVSNSLIGTTIVQRNISVNASAAVPNLFAIPSPTSISTEVGKASSNVTITYYNYGDAPLTISSIEGNGGQFITNIAKTGPSVTSIAAGGSASTTYTFTRSNIGTSLTTITILSNDPAGAKTALISVTGIARVPTFTLKNDGVATTTSWTDRAGTLKKNTAVRTEISNMEPNTVGGFWLFWTEGQNSLGSNGFGRWADPSALTDPKQCPVNSFTSNANGFAAPWQGTDPIEVRYWRAGRNRFYGQIPVGKYDNGLQAWYTNSTSGTSAAGSGSWASTTTSPEAACGSNQIWIGFNVIPNMSVSWGNTTPVQGDNITITITGAASEVSLAVGVISSFTVDTGTYTSNYSYPFSYTNTLTTAGGDLTLSAVANGPVGTYANIQAVGPGGDGFIFTYIYSTPAGTTFDVLSPQLYVVQEIDPAFGLGTGAVSPSSNVNGAQGSFSIFRRFNTGGNGTYAVRVVALADNSVAVYCQGIKLVEAPDWFNPYTAEVNITVTDTFSHWRFDFVNGGGPGYFAVAVYVGAGYTNLYFATESGICLTESKW